MTIHRPWPQCRTCDEQAECAAQSEPGLCTGFPEEEDWTPISGIREILAYLRQRLRAHSSQQYANATPQNRMAAYWVRQELRRTIARIESGNLGEVNNGE